MIIDIALAGLITVLSVVSVFLVLIAVSKWTVDRD